MRERLYYVAIWIIAVIAFSVPWATVNGENFVGWNFVFPFSFFYLVGLLLGLIVLLTKAHPFVLSLVAGILLLFGVFGGVAGAGLMKLGGELVGDMVEYEWGLGFAFIWSIVYTVAGSVLGNRMAQREQRGVKS